MPETKWDASTGHRSVSQLNTMSNCGWAYYLEKVVRAPQRAAAWFVQGTAVHTAVQVYEESGRALVADEVAAIFEQAWDTDIAVAWEKQPDPKMWMVGGRAKVETDISNRRAKGRQQAIDYVMNNGPNEILLPAELAPGVPAVEVGFDIDFGGVRVIGYIDLVLEDRRTGELIVRDIKTGTKMPVGPFQFATYRVAVEQMTGQPVKWGDYWMCKDASSSPPMDLSLYTWAEVATWYKNMDAMVKDERFLANPGECFTCSVKPYCRYVSTNPLPIPERNAA